MPWWVETRPLAFRFEIASRTTVRLTSNSSIRSFSVGSWSPRLYWPDWMRSVRASISIEVSDCRGGRPTYISYAARS